MNFVVTPGSVGIATFPIFRPFAYTDPDGHKSWWSKFWKSFSKILEAVAIVAVGAVVWAFAPYLGPVLTDIELGAITGATIGGATAAALGGNIGQGLATGAIGGAIFGGIGAMGLSGPAEVAAHAAGGAASGAIDTAISGGNAGINAIISGLSAGGSEWAGENVQLLKLTGSYMQDVVRQAALGGVIGGATSAAFGGSFMNGFTKGAETSAIAYTANDWSHFHSDGQLLGVNKANSTEEWGSLWSLDASYDFQSSDDNQLNVSWGIKDPYLSFGASFDSQNGSLSSVSLGVGMGSPVTVTTSTLGSLYKQPDEIGAEIARNYQEEECAASVGSDC